MGSSKPKARRTRKKQTKGRHLPLKPGTITKESSCSMCRIRKVRCTGERPACTLCIKGAAAKGLPASGVRCVFSGASALATREDKEFEAQAGGRGAKCRWGDEEKKGEEPVKSDDTAEDAQPEVDAEGGDEDAGGQDENCATLPVPQAAGLPYRASPLPASSSPAPHAFTLLRPAEHHAHYSHFSPPPSPLPAFDLASFNMPTPPLARFANTAVASASVAPRDPLFCSLLTPDLTLAYSPPAAMPRRALADDSVSSAHLPAHDPSAPPPAPVQLVHGLCHPPQPQLAYLPARHAQPGVPPLFLSPSPSRTNDFRPRAPAPFLLDLAFPDPQLPTPAAPIFDAPAPSVSLQLDTALPLTFDPLASASAFSPTAYLASTPLEPLPFAMTALEHQHHLALDEPYSFSMFRADPWQGLQMPPFEQGGSAWGR
ncbi:hypothetical protein JCM3770_003890 [Rhodotorula araucariae]